MGAISLIALLIAAIAFSAGGILVGKILVKGSNNPQKGQAYECGIPTNTSPWHQFNVGYYLFALLLASFVNAFSVLCITGHKMLSNEKEVHRIEPKNYIYVVPCYNESEEELEKSLQSLTLQRIVNKDKRSLLILCDGMVIGNSKGKDNTMTTNSILKKILNINELAEFYDYKTWDENRNIIKIHTGVYNYSGEIIDFVLIIKNKNYGKRDSLVLARKMCYNYNVHIAKEDDEKIYDFTVSENLFKYIFDLFKAIYETNIDYMIGIDADTVFDYNCSYELIQAIEKDSKVHGCVGYVDILPASNKQKYSPYILYQYGEYMFSQCLRRYAQSAITKKVNCLSGCNQILRVNKETCGNAILNVLNYLPAEDENIFNHIRSYASEDRNHICHMMSMYPYVESTQTLKAIAYTSVPTSVKVFLSQRRRWNLGAITNDMLLVHMPDINPFERIAAGINVTTFCILPFIFIATAAFIKAIITNPTMLMLYLSIIIFIPFLYSFLIPVFIRPLSFRDTMYYYLAYLFFLAVGSFIKLLTFGYSIYYMDSMTWGKTREIAARNTPPSTPEPAELLMIMPATPVRDETWIQVMDELKTVIVSSPNDIMEEYITTYCDNNVYEMLPVAADLNNGLYEITI